MNTTVSIILPSYNEKENILPLIEEIHERLANADHEIVVVDDNSPDGTADAVAGRQYPYVSVVKRAGPRGFARSIREGIERSKGDRIVMMDSDFNHQPRYIPALLEALEYGDGASASRFLPGGRMNNALRHALSGIFNRFVRLVTGSRMTDNLYGFFALRRTALCRCPFEYIFEGFGEYSIRLLYFLQKNGASLREVPAVNGERRAGKGNTRFIRLFFRYVVTTLQVGCRGRIYPAAAPAKS